MIWLECPPREDPSQPRPDGAIERGILDEQGSNHHLLVVRISMPLEVTDNSPIERQKSQQSAKIGAAETEPVSDRLGEPYRF